LIRVSTRLTFSIDLARSFQPKALHSAISSSMGGRGGGFFSLAGDSLEVRLPIAPFLCGKFVNLIVSISLAAIVCRLVIGRGRLPIPPGGLCPDGALHPWSFGYSHSRASSSLSFDHNSEISSSRLLSFSKRSIFSSVLI